MNLAWLIAEERKHKTVLVDLDLEFGTIALSLDLEPTRGLREALENPARVDGLFIASATAKLTDNLSIMATEENMTAEAQYNQDRKSKRPNSSHKCAPRMMSYARNKKTKLR